MAKAKKTTTARKATAKKTSSKKTPAKKTATRAKAKPTTTRKPRAQAKKPTATRKAPAKKPTATKAKATRRPNPNLPPTPGMVNSLTGEVMSLIEQLENYTANLRALDRVRHNGVGLKREGFIEATLRIATQFPQYYPHWLDTDKFNDDLALFNAVKSLVSACRALEEKAWNINIEASDMVYTDALEYYSQVKDAAKRRIDPAETLYAELFSFWKRGPMESEEPTRKKLKRDVNALERGTKNGKIVIENIRPKTTGGVHRVVDETFRDEASFKDTVEGDVKE